MKRHSALAAAIAAVALFLAAALPARADGPEPGETAPELEVKAWVNGGPLKLSELEGSVVAVLFMHTSAPDMGSITTDFSKMLGTYGPRGLKMIGISRENKDLLLNWLDENKVDFPVAVDDGSWKGKYAINGYPFVYLVDIYGEIAWKGDAKVEVVMPQIELCLKEVKRVNVKREDTGKSFEKVWRALDKNEYPNAIKFLQTLAKSKDDDDRADAEALLRDLEGIATARLTRVAELEKRKDYASGETILRSVERLFAGLPPSKTARDTLALWQKTPAIKAELDAQKLYEEGRALEEAKHYKQAAEMYRAAMARPGTGAARKALARLNELVRKGHVRA